MESNRQRVVLITGASSGIGEACSQILYQRGYRVFGTSRRASNTVDPPGSVKMIPMDVTSEDSVERGVKHILDLTGRLDVVVNCAGYGLAGAVEDTQADEARAQLETNFFGVFRVCRAVLPVMREQGSGYLINISSIGGLIGIPFQGIYSASKFAVEGFTEALRAEVRPYGIRVVMIEPGDFRTGFTAHRRKTRTAQGTKTVYGERFVKALGVMEADETKGPTPERIGHLLAHIITMKSPRLRYMAGPLSEKLAVELKKILPFKWFEWAIMKYYRIL